MPLYLYTARDKTGKEIKGEVSGDSKQNVVTILKMQELFPLLINEKTEKVSNKSVGIDLFEKKVKKKHITIFTRQFASMLQAGVPLTVILDVMIKQESNVTFKKILESINTDIMKGNTLSQAMSKFKVFPVILISMVEVGEVNGRLDVSFERVALNMEKEIKLASKIKGAMIYPIVLLTITLLVSTLLTFIVMPIFTKMFEQMGAKLPPLTVSFINISQFFTGYWYIVTGLILIITFIIFKLLKEPLMRKEIDRVMLHVPIVGKIQNTILMARFCRTFSALVESGVDVVVSLQTVKNVVNNLSIKSKFDEIVHDVQSGSTISRAISKYSIFTPLVISMVRIGEESGRLGDVLAKTAEIYEDESDAQLQRATAMAEPAVTLIMALGVGFIVLSIVQPMFKMYSIIGK
jgi:type IV pilus assembly protein PilC